MAAKILKEEASQIAEEFIKNQKKTSKVDVVVVETYDDAFVVRGACPMFIEGQFWAERFEVVVDQSGKIKSTSSKKIR